jgi:hypothetical protein
MKRERSKTEMPARSANVANASLLAPEALLAGGLDDELREGPLDPPDVWWRKDPPPASRLSRTIDCWYGIAPGKGPSPLGGRDEELV